MDAKIHIYLATALGRDKVASLMLSCLYPQSPWYSFYRRLNGPLDQSGHIGVKKYFHPSDTWDRTQAVPPIVNCLALQ